MPKMKSKSGAKKRFRVTGSGRVKRAQAFKRHIMIRKSSKRSRRLRQMNMVSKADERQVKRMLLLA